MRKISEVVAFTDKASFSIINITPKVYSNKKEGK